jgi:hypothetical protein
MNVIPKIFPAETSHPPICTRFQNLYVQKVKDLFFFIRQKKMDFLACVVATFLIEPHSTLRAAYLMQKGLNRKKIINLNPKILSTDQLNCTPVLLIHGDSSNSGLFGPMIDQIARDAPHKPIFTIDLTSPDGIVSAKSHLHLIDAKVNEIAALYPSSKSLKISFVGHSSGGDVLGPLIRLMEANKWPQSGTIIKIGSIFKKNEAEEFCRYPHEKVIEIAGTKDIFEGCESHLPNRLIVVSGHLGLLFNKTVLEYVSKEI